MSVNEKDVRSALKTVKDPELNLDLVVLGLVYDIEVDEGDVHVVMSLTSPMCPVADQIVTDARNAISEIEGVESRCDDPGANSETTAPTRLGTRRRGPLHHA